MNFENREPNSEDLKRVEELWEKDIPEVEGRVKLRGGKPELKAEVEMDKKVAQEVLNSFGVERSEEIREMYQALRRAQDFGKDEDELFLETIDSLKKVGV